MDIPVNETSFTMTLILFVCISMFVCFMVSHLYAQQSPWRIKNDEAEKLLARSDFDLILDVRTAVERKVFGFYPGSINVPISKLKTRIPEIQPDKNAKILTYCMSGQRAKYATNQLHKMGYKNAFYVTLPPAHPSSSLFR